MVELVVRGPEERHQLEVAVFLERASDELEFPARRSFQIEDPGPGVVHVEQQVPAVVALDGFAGLRRHRDRVVLEPCSPRLQAQLDDLAGIGPVQGNRLGGDERSRLPDLYRDSPAGKTDAGQGYRPSGGGSRQDARGKGDLRYLDILAQALPAHRHRMDGNPFPPVGVQNLRQLPGKIVGAVTEDDHAGQGLALSPVFSQRGKSGLEAGPGPGGRKFGTRSDLPNLPVEMECLELEAFFQIGQDVPRPWIQPPQHRLPAGLARAVWECHALGAVDEQGNSALPGQVGGDP